MKKNNGQIIGIVGALIVHLLIIALLLLVVLRQPEKNLESGVPVMLGNIDLSQGSFDPNMAQSETVDPIQEEVTPPPPPPTPKVDQQELITQTNEETVALKPKTEKKKELVKPVVKPVKPEKSAAQKALEVKQETERREAEARKAAAEAATKRVSGAFGKGTQMGNKGTGTTGAGTEGSPQGNSSIGKSTGAGGLGEWELGGRSIGEGGLPRPAYNAKEEGTVVVTIQVDAAGNVVDTSIHKRTNTASPALRKAAEEAARRARFNTVNGSTIQVGTITYKFYLK